MECHQKIATRIVKTLQEAGHTAYFAGGWVRDFLMGLPSDDIDIASSADTEQVAALFQKTVPVGVSFGIIVVIEEGHSFEVATFRKDRAYEDGRRPTGIEKAAPIEDAQRRDFTINGMFYDPLTEILYDYVGGKQDLEAKLIRAIGNAQERICEDRLRMMRAARYATRFGFSLEEKTLQAIKKNAASLLPSVALERVWQEFKKMSAFACFDLGLILLHTLGLLPTIFPSLQEVTEEEIRQRVAYISRFPKNAPPFAELLELFPHYDLEEVFTLAEFLKMSKKECAFAEFYYKAKELFAMPSSWLEDLERFEWASFYADPHSSLCLALVAVKQEDPEGFRHLHATRAQSLAHHIERIQKNHPYLRAEHLLQAGIPPGKHLGTLLQEGMRLAVNKELLNPEELLLELKKQGAF